MGIELDQRRVIERATSAAFGKPLVTNVLRSMLVEAMLAEVLSPSWEWCAADYSSCDFRHVDGTRLEVKQAAAKQSWHDENSSPSKPKYDIAARTGRWEGSVWIPGEGRNAEIYVFGFHPLIDISADHREPSQWRFYVVAASELPATKSMSLGGVKSLAYELTLESVFVAADAIRLR